jgi:hypothetical protein
MSPRHNFQCYYFFRNEKLGTKHHSTVVEDIRWKLTSALVLIRGRKNREYLATFPSELHCVRMHSIVANSWKDLPVNFAILLRDIQITHVQCYWGPTVKIFSTATFEQRGRGNGHLATLGETVKYWENRTATEKTQFQKLAAHPSLAQEGGCEIFPFYPFLYSLV